MPSRVSPEASDLIKKMITVNVKERISASEILNHPWILKYEKNGCCDDGDINHEHVDENKEAITRLRSYRGQSLLKRTSINLLVKQLAPHQIASLKEQF